MAASILSSKWPAGPTKGLPRRSSSLPGASPISIARAAGLPSKTQVVVAVFLSAQPSKSAMARTKILDRGGAGRPPGGRRPGNRPPRPAPGRGRSGAAAGWGRGGEASSAAAAAKRSIGASSRVSSTPISTCHCSSPASRARSVVMVRTPVNTPIVPRTAVRYEGCEARFDGRCQRVSPRNTGRRAVLAPLTMTGMLFIAAASPGSAVADAAGSGPLLAQVEAAPSGPGGPPAAMTAAGAFLAAQHALAQRDMAAAADYLLAALDRDPANGQALRQAHFALVSSGRVAEAVPLARELVEQGPEEQFSSLTLTADAPRPRRLGGRARRARRLRAQRIRRRPGAADRVLDRGRPREPRARSRRPGRLRSRRRPRSRAGLSCRSDRGAAGDAEAADTAFRAALALDRAALAYGDFLERQGRPLEGARGL